MELNKKVADFTLQTDEDKTVSLSDYAGKPVILFFYPRADTPGCTIEACGFRDTFKKLQAAGAVVLGISRDTPRDQAKFRAKYDLPYTLLADVDEKVCNQFGVMKEKNMYGKKVMGIAADDVLDRPRPDAAAHLPQGQARRPRRRGAGADQGMEQDAQIASRQVSELAGGVHCAGLSRGFSRIGRSQKKYEDSRSPVAAERSSRPPPSTSPRACSASCWFIARATASSPAGSLKWKPISGRITKSPTRLRIRIADPRRETPFSSALQAMRMFMQSMASTTA